MTKELIGLSAALVLTGILSTGCSQSPMAPSATAAPVVPQATTNAGVLTVRVLARASELPIAGATVHTLTAHGVTDTQGVCTLPVSTGQELDVNVSADGYEPMGASGVLGTDERWTFYLPLSN